MLNMYYNPESFGCGKINEKPTPEDELKFKKHTLFMSLKPLIISQVFIAFFIILSIVFEIYLKNCSVYNLWTDYFQIALILAVCGIYLYVRPQKEQDIKKIHEILVYLNIAMIMLYGMATALTAQQEGKPSVHFMLALILTVMLANIRFGHMVIIVALSGAVMFFLTFIYMPRNGIDPEMLVLNAAAVFMTFYIGYVKYKYYREIYFHKMLLEKQQLFMSNINRELEKMLHDQLDTILRSEMLARYLPPELVDVILNGKPPERTAEKAKLTVFFSDIKDFTKTSDIMAPEELARILNEYMDEMIKIAKKYRATLDKFVGDAIMIFFGAPEKTNDKDHAVRCVKMAIEMQQAMKILQKKWFDEGYEKPFSIRIGINTGVSIVGNFGSLERLSYTAIGKQVNIAARLEQACDPGSILISHPTYVLVKDQIKCDEGAKYALKGLSEEITAYKVIF